MSVTLTIKSRSIRITKIIMSLKRYLKNKRLIIHWNNAKRRRKCLMERLIILFNRSKALNLCLYRKKENFQIKIMINKHQP